MSFDFCWEQFVEWVKSLILCFNRSLSGGLGTFSSASHMHQMTMQTLSEHQCGPFLPTTLHLSSNFNQGLVWISLNWRSTFLESISIGFSVICVLESLWEVKKSANFLISISCKKKKILYWGWTISLYSLWISFPGWSSALFKILQCMDQATNVILESCWRSVLSTNFVIKIFSWLFQKAGKILIYPMGQYPLEIQLCSIIQTL